MVKQSALAHTDYRLLVMVKIDFTRVIKAGGSGRPVFLTLLINWGIKPITIYGIALVFLGVLLKGFIGPEATDLIRLPFGLDVPLGVTHGDGTRIKLGEARAGTTSRFAYQISHD